MMSILATLTIDPDREAAFEAAFAALIRVVRESEPGCVLYQLNRSAETPGRYYVFESYRSEADLDEHMRSTHTLVAQAALGGYLVEPPIIERLVSA